MILVFIGIIIVLLYIIFNLYSKLDALYSQINSYYNVENNAIVLIENLIVTYTKVLSKLKRIDRLGSFESDDEVGFVFKTLKKTIEELVSELKVLQTKLNENDANSAEANKK